MKHIFALFAIIAATFATSVSAEELAPFYASVFVSASSLNMSPTSPTSHFDTFDKNGSGYGTAFGLQVHPNAAIEVVYNDYGSRNGTFMRYGATVTDSVNLTDIGVFANLSTPVSDKVRVFVKPGVVDARAHSFGFNNKDLCKTEFAIAAGAEYEMHPNAAVFVAIGRMNNFGDTGAHMTTATFGVRIHR